MVRDHVKAVDLFRTASTQLSDGPAKEFAAKTLPTLEMHLSEAKRLQAQMGND
jgi:putative membrane protein